MMDKQERVVAPLPTGSRRVLVVDDEEAIVRMIARRLGASGYDVTTAADGQEAMNLLAQTSFDAIVSDIDMPRVNGIQLLKATRQRDPDVPFILMTGVPDLDTAMDAVALGALLYLPKPLELADLEVTIGRAVRLSQVARLKREALALVDDGGSGGGDRIGLAASFERTLATLWMAYQPIVRVSDRALFGYEALLRSEEKALPHPGAILGAAERLGRLDELGRTVRARAARDVGGESSAIIFVNLHSSDLMDPTLLSETSPLSMVADRVVLEITERASLDGVQDARAKIAELRRMGFRIAIDDLGAGYAGLTSFATLEPEFVKLDMSLIRGVNQSSTKEKLIRSMTTLCKELGMIVVAEGVETIAERETLVSLGCDLLQGYLLARPGRAFPEFTW